MPGGRPTSYDPDLHPIWVWGLAKDDMTEPDMAAHIHISYKQFRIWKNKYPEFRSALKEGKEATDNKVEQALVKRAMGFKYRERKIYINKSKDANGKEVETRREEITEKEVPPDTIACIYWLKNRKRGVWRDKPDEVSQVEETSSNLIEAITKAAERDVAIEA